MQKLAILFYVSLFTGLFFLMSCDNDDNDMDTVAPTNSIVATAQATPELSLLVEALLTVDQEENIDLVNILSGEGPFTVFAPTNEAFAAVLDALGPDYNSLEDFDTAGERELLASILTYHVVAGTAAFAESLSNGQSIPTVQTENVTIALENDSVLVGDSTDAAAFVVIADVAASNGVVHVIDKVLLPQEAIDALGL